MNPMPVATLKKDALVGLLDDPSPFVRRTLLGYFQTWETPASASCVRSPTVPTASQQAMRVGISQNSSSQTP